MIVNAVESCEIYSNTIIFKTFVDIVSTFEDSSFNLSSI